MSSVTNRTPAMRRSKRPSDPAVKRGKLSRLAINDEGFAFDPASGDIYLLSPTGLSIIRHLLSGDDVGELAQVWSRQYGIPQESAARDIREFLVSLQSFRLL